MITVISLGGSIVAPDAVDVEYLAAFKALIEERIAASAAARFVLVTGGGAPARRYQSAYHAVLRHAGADEGESSAAEADWIGIMATRLNAQLVRAAFAAHAPDAVVTDPTAPFTWQSRVLVAAGWKPGFSSDNDAVLLARRFGAPLVINLSNIEKVYTADPKLDSTARALDAISWADFRRLTGDEWTPGKNVPFDPVASRNAEEAGIRVICAAGKNIPNLRNILTGAPFTGTTIG
ncbi:MAG: UMP kinase [Spirochaetaceae bacterium]|jgi:uridylate kinase|nr:UMP kinase [Spirochaetaceae bacterium]